MVYLWWHERKSQWITRVGWIHPQGTMNLNTKCYGNESKAVVTMWTEWHCDPTIHITYTGMVTYHQIIKTNQSNKFWKPNVFVWLACPVLVSLLSFTCFLLNNRQMDLLCVLFLIFDSIEFIFNLSAVSLLLPADDLWRIKLSDSWFLSHFQSVSVTSSLTT